MCMCARDMRACEHMSTHTCALVCKDMCACAYVCAYAHMNVYCAHVCEHVCAYVVYVCVLEWRVHSKPFLMCVVHIPSIQSM